MKLTYRKAGVDVAKAEEFVKGIGRLLASKKGGTKAFGSLFDLAEDRPGIKSSYRCGGGSCGHECK